MSIDADLVMLAIRSAVRLGEQARHAYADSVRAAAITLPLPDFPADPGIDSIDAFYRSDAGRPFATGNARVAALLVRLGAVGSHGLTEAEAGEFARLFAEHWALVEARAGRFASPSQAEPTLDDLLEAHSEGNGRKRPGSFMLAAALAGLLLTGAGTLFVMRRRRKPRRLSRAAALAHLPEQVDLEFARKRAIDLAEELGAAGQRGVRKAKKRVKDVDLERARVTAVDVATALEGRARQAPDLARTAARSARKRSKRGKKSGWMLLPLIAGMLMPRKEEKKRRRPWRA